ncbi:hypothetical protein [Kitasatospora sp. NPDC088351]|uniref:Rv1733c family protein n=1 Tax=unclassified Kitasatospora TaxID=2633591 RepID=UPI00343F5701
MSSTPRPTRAASLPRRAGRHLRRALGARRDPLVRPLDRSRSRAWAAALLGLLLALSAAVGAALLSFHAADHDASADRARLHRVDAVLLTAARPGNAANSRWAGGYESRADVTVSWTYPDGQQHTGRAEAPRSATAGSTVTVWVDDDGGRADPPATRVGVAVEAVCTGLSGFAALAAALGGGLALRLRALDRRADQEWQRSWARLEPLWSGRGSRSPGGPQEG